MSHTITITIQAFGAARDALHERSFELSVPAPTDIEAVWQHLCQTSPDLMVLEGSMAFARNQDIVDRSTPLQAGDQLALLPPVSGG